MECISGLEGTQRTLRAKHQDWGRQFIQPYRGNEMSGGRWDQHRKRYGDTKGKPWLPTVSAIEVHNGLSSTRTQRSETRQSHREQ